MASDLPGWCSARTQRPAPTEGRSVPRTGVAPPKSSAPGTPAPAATGHRSSAGAGARHGPRPGLGRGKRRPCQPLAHLPPGQPAERWLIPEPAPRRAARGIGAADALPRRGVLRRWRFTAARCHRELKRPRTFPGPVPPAGRGAGQPSPCFHVLCEAWQASEEAGGTGLLGVQSLCSAWTAPRGTGPARAHCPERAGGTRPDATAPVTCPPTGSAASGKAGRREREGSRVRVPGARRRQED